jgi:hypothetical protein
MPVIAACGAEEIELTSGSVKVICGGTATPCNLRIVAPLGLERARVSIDGVDTTILFPNEIEHPLRNLILITVGVHPTSDAAVAICHLPPGTHTVRIVKPGWHPIVRTVVRVSALTHMQQLQITADELGPLKKESQD